MLLFMFTHLYNTCTDANISKCRDVTYTVPEPVFGCWFVHSQMLLFIFLQIYTKFTYCFLVYCWLSLSPFDEKCMHMICENEQYNKYDEVGSQLCRMYIYVWYRYVQMNSKTKTNICTICVRELLQLDLSYPSPQDPRDPTVKAKLRILLSQITTPRDTAI